MSARGGSQNARTEELFTENSQLALGDAVAHEETVFALLFFSSPTHRLAEPYTLLRLKDEGQSTLHIPHFMITAN